MCACFTTSVVVQGPEEEVKVPLAEDIEEGEVTSDEEGEIKGRQGNLFAPYVYMHVVITHVPPLLHAESDDGGNEATPTAPPTITDTHSVPESNQDTNTTTTTGERNTQSLLCVMYV